MLFRKTTVFSFSKEGKKLKFLGKEELAETYNEESERWVRDKSKSPKVGDILGDGADRRKVVAVDGHQLTYKDAQGQEHTIGIKSWTDFFRDR